MNQVAILRETIVVMRTLAESLGHKERSEECLLLLEELDRVTPEDQKNEG